LIFARVIAQSEQSGPSKCRKPDVGFDSGVVFGIERGEEWAMSTQEAADPRKRCSTVPALALATISIVFVVDLLTSLSNVEAFIKQTGGELCFVYSDIRIHTAFNAIETLFTAVLATATAALARRGHCRLSGGFCLLSFV